MARPDKKRILKKWILRVSIEPCYKSLRQFIDIHALYAMYVNTYQLYKDKYGDDNIFMHHKSFHRCIDSIITSSEIVEFGNLRRNIERRSNSRQITYTILSDQEIDLDLTNTKSDKTTIKTEK